MNSQTQKINQNESFSECLQPDFIPLDINSTSEILPKLKVYQFYSFYRNYQPI